MNPLRKKSLVVVIYLDYRKCLILYHTTSYFTSYGLLGYWWSVVWFRAYLSSRYQMVRVNRQHSHIFPVISGFPQGSILGPLRFLIYVNDIPASILHSSVLLFADDTKCYKHVKCPSDIALIQQELDALFTWSNSWKQIFSQVEVPPTKNFSLMMRKWSTTWGGGTSID